MCDFNLATAAVGAQAAGGVASAWGAYTKAKGERYAYEQQAIVAENNRQYAMWQAADATARGETAAGRHQMKVAQLKGSQRAALAERGIDLGEGSALDIMSDTDYMGAIDVNTIKDNAGKEAWAYRTQASNYGANADLLRYRAESTSPAGSAFGSLLTSAGSVASSWYTLNEKGAFGKKKS